MQDNLAIIEENSTIQIQTLPFTSNVLSVKFRNKTVTQIQELQLLKQRLQEMEQKATILENSIKSAMGDKEELVYKGVVLATYKFCERETLNQKQLKTDLPEIFNRFISKVSYRRFQLKMGKGFN